MISGPNESSSENESSDDEDENLTLETIQTNTMSDAITQENGICKVLKIVQELSGAVKHTSTAVTMMQSDLAQIKEERKRDRDLLKHIRMALIEGNTRMPATPEEQTGRNAPSSPSTPASRSTTIQPRFIKAPIAGRMLLGGDEGMDRDITWYMELLKQVTWKKKTTDADNGRLLCMKLLRAEFSKEDLASKNVSGVSRDENQKVVQIEKLDPRVLNAIFNQARYQFPQYDHCYTNIGCSTVKDLNNICQKIRKERGGERQLGAVNDNGEQAANDADVAAD